MTKIRAFALFLALAFAGFAGGAGFIDGIQSTVAGGGGGPTFVQATANNTKVATLTVTAGDFLIVGYGSGNGGAQTPTIADTAINTWTPVSGSPNLDASNNATQALWWSIANGSGSTTVTITTTGVTFNGITFAEYSGIAASPADGANKVSNQTATMTANALTTGSVTPSADGGMVFSFIMDTSAIDDTAVFTAGTSPNAFTKRTTGSHTGDGATLVFAIEDFVQTTAAAINPTWTYNDTTKYAGITAVFKHQ